MSVPKLKLIILLTLCLAVSQTLATPIRYCNKKADYAVKVKGVDISPKTVHPGKEATFKISASTAEALSGGQVSIDVAYFGIHVHSETIDLCKEASCPISVGDFILSHSQTLPIITPPGSYTLKMQIYNSNKSLLTCISFGFTVGYGSSVSDI